MSFLERINTPRDLKNLTSNQLPKLCSELREFIISACSENPGHIGASLGAVELAVAIHYVYNTPADKVVWDVGHQAYAHKIITGRRDAFKNNRRYNGISGFPKMAESEYDAFGVGHSSTSISAALGIAVGMQLKGEHNKVVAVIGDGALSGGLAYEGLNNAGALKSDILVILNDNQISIDPNVGAMHNYLLKISTSPTYNRIRNRIWNTIGSGRLRRILQKFLFSTKAAFFKSGSLFESMGFRYFGAIDGNDINQLIVTLTNLKSIPGPKLLHVITKKGKGYEPAEKDQIVWHAPGTFDKNTGKRNGGGSFISKYQDVFGETLLRLAKENPSIIGITPAMPTGCSMNILMQQMPSRAFDVGIAEQHAVTFSAGLATKGLLPYCNIYSSFIQRAYDSVIHDVALQDLKVIFCLDRGGLVGEDGATHHGVFDISAFRPVPNLSIMAPMNEAELRDMLYSVQSKEYRAAIIRYPKGYGTGTEWRSDFKKIEYGKARLLRDGEDIALLTIGTAGNYASEAAEEADKKGICVMHWDMRFIKPIDTEAIEQSVRKCGTIITVEDGSVTGGLYSAVCEYVASKGHNVTVKGLGVPDRFIEQGSVSELVAECGYDRDGILKTIIDVSQRSE